MGALVLPQARCADLTGGLMAAVPVPRGNKTSMADDIPTERFSGIIKALGS
jgi:hypothetical protein